MKALTGIAVAVVLLVAPSTGVAQAKLPVGETDGVRVVRDDRGAIVVVFTQRAAKLYKRIAGKLVEVSCTEFDDETDGPGFSGSNTGGETLRAPERGRKLVTGDTTRGMDYCRVWLARRTVRSHGERQRIGRQLIVSVPLTQRGAVFLDEESKARDLFGVLIVASIVAERQKLEAYPTYAQLIKGIPKAARVLVALANPADTPPARKIGYYSDGQAHVAVATLSNSGRRLFIEFAGDVLTTNVVGYIYNTPE